MRNDERSFVRRWTTARAAMRSATAGVILAAGLCTLPVPARAGTALTYQGSLSDSGQPVVSADLDFQLYDVASGGSPVTIPIQLNDVPLQDGRFTATVDFGDVFTGEDLWLQVAVRTPHDPDDVQPYTVLTPRQAVSSVPTALHAAAGGQPGSNTLDLAYDQGGPGAGRVIVADSGPVTIAGPDGASVLGKVGIGGPPGNVPLDVTLGSDVTPGGGGYAMTGSQAQTNLAIDDDEIMARDGGASSPLFFNHNGGDVLVNDAGSGRLGIGTNNPIMTMHVNGGLHLAGTSEDLSWPPGQGLEMGTWNSSVFDDYLWIFASGGAATVNLLGTGALPNVRMHATSGTSTRGAVGAVNQNGLALAYMEVATDGTGRIVANVKNFRVDNPRDPATEICYASLEGPEAAVYVRGTARLEGGRATIDLPAHFQDVASEKGMTVELTPRSASSLGLAAIERSPSRLVVKELRRGQGDYDFDWLVKAVRRGHEDFRVVRPRSDDERASAWTPPEPTDAALRQQRSVATKEADDERH